MQSWPVQKGRGGSEAVFHKPLSVVSWAVDGYAAAVESPCGLAAPSGLTHSVEPYRRGGAWSSNHGIGVGLSLNSCPEATHFRETFVDGNIRFDVDTIIFRIRN